SAARLGDVVLTAEHVLHEPEIRRALRPEALHAADIDVAHQVAPRDEWRERRREIRLDVLADACPAEAKPERVQRPIRPHVAVLAGEKLVARKERAWKLRVIRWQALIAIVERVPCE